MFFYFLYNFFNFIYNNIIFYIYCITSYKYNKDYLPILSFLTRKLLPTDNIPKSKKDQPIPKDPIPPAPKEPTSKKRRTIYSSH